MHSLSRNPVFGRVVKYRYVRRAGLTRLVCGQLCPMGLVRVFSERMPAYPPHPAMGDWKEGGLSFRQHLWMGTVFLQMLTNGAGQVFIPIWRLASIQVKSLFP